MSIETCGLAALLLFSSLIPPPLRNLRPPDRQAVHRTRVLLDGAFDQFDRVLGHDEEPLLPKGQ